MAEQITTVIGESCIGCRHLHLHMGQYRCFKASHAKEGEFICWPKIGTQYPKPIRNRATCYTVGDKFENKVADLINLVTRIPEHHIFEG